MSPYHTYLVVDSDGLLVAVVPALNELAARRKAAEALGEPMAFLHADRISPGMVRDVRQCLGKDAS